MSRREKVKIKQIREFVGNFGRGKSELVIFRRVTPPRRRRCLAAEADRQRRRRAARRSRPSTARDRSVSVAYTARRRDNFVIDNRIRLQFKKPRTVGEKFVKITLICFFRSKPVGFSRFSTSTAKLDPAGTSGKSCCYFFVRRFFWFCRVRTFPVAGEKQCMRNTIRLTNEQKPTLPNQDVTPWGGKKKTYFQFKTNITVVKMSRRFPKMD